MPNLSHVLKSILAQLTSNELSAEAAKKRDLAWIIGCLSFKENEVTVKVANSPGTWGAFNSLLCSAGLKTNIALVPPLIRLPPTQYDILYTAMMRAQAIATSCMGLEAITVITLDLQLYDMAMKLWMTHEDIKKQFLFRPGELHVVFAALAALGKYVEGSGTDQAWVEAGLYSPTTVTHILNGKQLYRALEAHTVTLLALYSLFFQKFLKDQPEEEEFFENTSETLGKAFKVDAGLQPQNRHSLKEAVANTIEMFESRNITAKIKTFENKLSKLQRFVSIYLNQFETILQYVRASRQQDIALHMESTEALIKYFFAHDHLNYARMMPLYLHTMQKAKEDHPTVWEEFEKGNFCVTKGVAGFTSIGPDHAIEQENRELKVVGGIVGITQQEGALDKYFLIAPELSKIQQQFEQKYGSTGGDKRLEHHEMTGRKLSRVAENAVKLCHVFQEHGDPFCSAEENELVNMLTQSVMNDAVTNDILQRDAIGQQAFEEFVNQRLTEGKLSVWGRMTKNKVKTFKSESATAEIKIGNQLIKIKEERNLLQRFIVISRSRPDLDLKVCIGEYEFGVVPRSLFSADGSLLLPYDKASMLHHLENLKETPKDSEESEPEVPAEDISFSDGTQMEMELCSSKILSLPNTDFEIDAVSESDHHLHQGKYVPAVKISVIDEDENAEADMNVPFQHNISSSEQLEGQNETANDRILIIDGMAIVNSITKHDNMKTCADFAESFLSIICYMTQEYDEVRVVFDRYISPSLKSQTRSKRAQRKTTYYHVKDNTLIKNISLKEFLSDSRTKEELTEYLANKVVCHSRSPSNRLKRCMVTSGTTTQGNIPIPTCLESHDQEEADTIMILHASTVHKDAQVVVFSPDTDVLLLLVSHFPDLPKSTSFFTGKGRQRRLISIEDIHLKLGPKRSAALLGLHAFTGCDVTGRFGGRTKDWCFKEFLSCDDGILDALGNLGTEVLDPGTWAELERFVCLLYRSKSHKAVKDLRWFLFSNRAAEGENLPPTFGALYYHILRANFVTMIWKRATLSHTSLPSPVKFGWKFDDQANLYMPTLCLNKPAPESVLELLRCYCTTGCGERCGCSKSKNPCTEMCTCMLVNCANKPRESIGDGLEDD